MGKRKKGQKPPSEHSFPLVWILVAGVLLLGIAGIYFMTRPGTSTTSDSQDSTSHQPVQEDADVFAIYAGSKSCQDCHSAAYQLWQDSHHGLAERPILPSKDRSAFDPDQTLELEQGSNQGSKAVKVGIQKGQYQIRAPGRDGKPAVFPVKRVFGEEPLRQFLVPFPDGRLQATEWAFDPHQSEWFSVFGDEDRQPGEWGHWTGRGMNWNSMCASCHNTRLRKNYDPVNDSYDTSMAEMGVSCESCHGPMAEHVKWQNEYPDETPDPTLPDLSRDQMLDACGACHARRADLDGEFQPGDEFLDHFSLTIPNESDVYYPDGQVQGENYVYTSFLSSRMHQAGVRCVDCHEPHSATVRMEGNALCMQCHQGQRQDAPVIDPTAHSHHPAESAGNQCVGCHMPETVYMQRDPRRDHGFTIPDPLLTKQHGIPNACNRCHTDESTDWALEHVEQWYGDRMDRPYRHRAQRIAQARAGDTNAVAPLQKMAREEANPLWRAVAVDLLERWSGEPATTTHLLKSLQDPHPLVREAAVRTLEPLVQQNHPDVEPAMTKLLDDPVRSVRVSTAWALRSSLDTDSQAGRDLERHLDFNLDQPTGAYQMGVYLSDQGRHQEALDQFKRAVQWDPNSAPLREALAVNLSRQGKPRAALEQLQAACQLAPDDPEFRYKLGLAYNEVGNLNRAVAEMQKAVEIDPRFSRAWYNLGLAYSELGNPMEALNALQKAESIDPSSARIPYARATILARLDRAQEARDAAQRALEIQPGYPPASRLLQMLPPQGR